MEDENILTPKEQKIKEIFDKIQPEYEKDNHFLASKDNEIKNKITKLKSFLFSKYQNNCKEHLTWFYDKGGKISEDENKELTMNIPENISNDKNFNLLTNCFHEQSWEIAEFFTKMKQKYEDNLSYKENCIHSCVINIEPNLEKDLNVCIKGCLKTSFDDLNNYYETLDKKINRFMKI